ncbi:ATP-binding cassette, subfamily B [Nakamurella panacisegetis]|uniref:ATP-binding cassette, subfamily B n=1 Tax=Nakamurella panacisegetis TaxID=1090615 RepID=A0A1H0L3R1_9ACTN|nr:ABC transporter ATP-binding protein [Nakamurella panacisegetis]SDO62676.1 ATP-binding cassette, subfamily B [Nakamurella panacisegetis]
MTTATRDTPTKAHINHASDDRPAPSAQPGDIRRIFRLFGEHKGRLALVGLLIVASSLISLASPFLLRNILDVTLPGRDTRGTVVLAIGMIVVAVSTTVLSVVQSRQSTLVGQGVMHRLRTAVYTHLQKLSLGFYTRTRTGEVQSRIANDIGGMQAAVTNTATTIVSSGTTVVATFVAMFALNWKLTLVSLVLVPLFVWISRRVGGMRRRIATNRQERMADMSSMVAESLSVSGILLTKTMGRTEELTRRFSTASEELADLEVRSAMTGRWRQSSIGIIIAILPAAIYLAAAFTVSGTTGAVSIGTLVAFTTLQGQLFRPMMQLLSTGVDVQTSLAMFRRVFDYLDLPVDVAEPDRPTRMANPKGALSFEHITFTYPGAATTTLDDVDLRIEPGQHVAVVGATGSGKTSLGYLGARLYEPDQGTVTLDGVPLGELTQVDLAGAIGIVSQETYLLHATIAENLRFAKPDASQPELEAAARAAQIHDLIAGLPEGYETVVGERGYRFSGGEKQRLAIARIILRNPQVLILDEATSALDTRTEAKVTDAIARLSRHRTTLTIAHRLSTVRDADVIVVMDHGRIVERGRHDELLARDGAYASLLARDAVLV